MAPTFHAVAESEWLPRAESHAARVHPWVAPRLQRQAAGQRHPVDDFLFDYYGYRPSHLLRWHPGLGTALSGPHARNWLHFAHYTRLPDGSVAADPATFPRHRHDSLRWIHNLLAGTASRPPHFGCHGLHEWAMVHRLQPGDVRHADWPLRLSPAGIAAFVESRPIACSHWDAFRFFTAAARPLNRLQPSRDSIRDLEQPGCLHANMDLYKWATKLAPLGPSELTADCLALAFEIRELDMRASPYDLSSLGLAPVPVETPEGRSDYERMQRAFSARADALRTRLRALCATLLACWDGDPVTPRAFPPASAQG